MARSDTMISSSAWAKLRQLQPRLQRLAILYGGLFLLMSFVLTWLTPGLAYGAKGVVGGDFLAFYTAGDMALQGQALDAYDFEAFDAALQTRVANEHLGMMWQYPPLMFFVVSALALLPYKLSLWVWLTATAGAFIWALNRILVSEAPEAASRRMTMLLILTSPLALMVVTSGQISLFTAALLMTAVYRPGQHWLVAGVAAGLLTLKPQLGVLIPFAFVATGAWRAFGAAAITALVLHTASVVAFGPETIAAFFNAVLRLQSDVAGSGTHTPPVNMTTLFGQLRYWQVPSGVAMAFHLGLAVFVLISVTWLWRKHRGDEARALYLAALVGAGAILVTPYAYAYEMAALAPAAIWLAFRSGRYAGLAIGVLSAGWLLLTVRAYVPLDLLIQMPFLVSLETFLLLLFADRKAPNPKAATV
ncbi:MAG: DUF2029 domain-containing protein [Henriciella sp.]|nr:DUF2029 domain-containing protein [Henriciella sp.]